MPNTLPAETLRSLRFRSVNNLPTPPALKLAAFKAIESMAPINAEYHDAITQALLDFFESKRGTVAAPKGRFKVAVSNAFNDAFDMGWAMGGGEFPVDNDANDWIGARMTAEFGYVDMLFEQAKQLKGSEDFNALAWVNERADAYTRTLKEIFNNGKVRAMKDIIVTFEGDDGAKSCDTCTKLKGSRHKLSWYVKRDFIPPHGVGLDCSKGGRCMHYLADLKGNQVTA